MCTKTCPTALRSCRSSDPAFRRCGIVEVHRLIDHLICRLTNRCNKAMQMPNNTLNPDSRQANACRSAPRVRGAGGLA
jgi:hypothetical protein